MFGEYQIGEFVYYIGYGKEPILCKLVDRIAINYPHDSVGYIDLATDYEYVLVPVAGKKREIWTYASEISRSNPSELINELYA